MRRTIETKLEGIGRRESVFGPRFVGLMRSAGATLGTGAVASAAGVGLAHLETRFPLVRHYDVPVAARPNLEETRILHISDLHMFSRQTHLVEFLHKVAAEEEFDLVISTGDNLGGNDGYALLLKALRPLMKKPGAFVLGSNDYYSPLSKPWIAYLDPRHYEKAADHHLDSPDLPWLDLVREMTGAGWLDLSNQSGHLEVPVGGDVQPVGVALVGVDDPHIRRDRMPALDQQWMNPSALRLALTHSPYRRVLNEFTRDGADLILAGHTHGGQIRLPGVGAIVNNCDIPRKYSRGLTTWEYGDSRSQMHISAGLGTSRNAQIRLFCRPEVSILRVCPTA